MYQLTGDKSDYRVPGIPLGLRASRQRKAKADNKAREKKQKNLLQEGGTETQAQDNYYWTCIFENLPKYDEDGNEIFYYAVENLAVNDPSTFHYAYPVFEYGEKTFDSVYGEGGKALSAK